jgi:hypothetical protein
MKLVIFLCCLTIFISCFFIFFTFQTLLDVKISCEFGMGPHIFSCDMEELSFSIIFGIIIVGLFLLVDTLVVYFMIKAWVPELLMYRFYRTARKSR